MKRSYLLGPNTHRHKAYGFKLFVLSDLSIASTMTSYELITASSAGINVLYAASV
jgi:hypothetical protein